MTAAGARRSRQHNAFTPKQRAFARSEIDERRRAIDRERRAGTVPASVSRGRGFGRLIFPFIGPMQRRFFRAQLDVVEAACLS